MVDKLKEAAMLFKAKITKDEIQELLLEATSDENWQTSTNILHEIANAAYNYEQWQRISAFIWEKLKHKKWKKIIKTLNLIEFLLKNGPPSILGTFKYEVYQFKSYDSFTCYDDGVDRGQAIREKAKQIVELLSNEQLLEQERVKAKNIRDRLSNLGGEGSRGYGGNSSSYKNQNIGKYQGYSNKTADKVSSSNTYSNSNTYDEGKSTLDKYKNYTGGSLYAKDTKEKEKEKQRQKEKEKDKTNDKQTQKKQQEISKPKPFEKQAPKIRKPGEKPQIPEPNITSSINTNQSKPPTNNNTVNIFQFDQQIPKKQEVPKINTPPIQQSVQQPNLSQVLTSIQTNPQQQFIQQPNNIPQNYQFTNNQAQTFPGFQFPVQQQTENKGGFNFMGQQQQQQQQQQTKQAEFKSSNIQYTYNSNVPKPQNKEQDEFGGFQTSNKEVKWLSKEQTNLIDLNDLGKQVLQKKKEQTIKQPAKKKQPQAGLLATQQDFENFLGSSTTTNTPSYNINMNINNLNFGLPTQSTNNYVNPVHPIGYVGNTLGGIYGQQPQINQMNPAQYQQWQYQQFLLQQQAYQRR